jgi:hypothetical protein
MYQRRDLHDQWVQIQDSQLEASTVFRPILESSRPPFACIGCLHGDRGVGSLVGSWTGFLTRSCCQWRRLPSRSDEVDELASPYTGLQLIVVCWGTGPAHGVPPGLVAMVPVGRWKLPRASLSVGAFVLFWYMCMKYCRVNGTLPGGAYPLARS